MEKIERVFLVIFSGAAMGTFFEMKAHVINHKKHKMLSW
jgi:hypothetical protein